MGEGLVPMIGDFFSNLLLVASGFIYLCGTYLVWPSKWNIPAHLATGFWSVAYVVPVLIVRVQDDFDPVAYDLFWRVSVVGAVFYALGLVFARTVMLTHPRSNQNARDFLPSLRFHTFDNDDDIYLRRLKLVAIVAIVLMVIALVVMGFVPILAPDSFAAKFLRGEYGEAYRPVAPLYRAATSIFACFMVVFAVLAVRRRTALWIVIFGSSVLLMILTLQRQPAASGILLALGIWLVARGQTRSFVILAIGANIAGTLWYAVLYQLGILKTESGLQVGFWASVAGSAPDVSDAARFFAQWMRFGEPLTDGRTFWGGLVPGRYTWNPSVWSLTLGDPRADPTKIISGGLRLPVSTWGFVSFGEVGVVIVPLMAGIVAGVLAILLRSALPAQDPVGSALILALYSVLQVTVGQFYALGYSNALALLVVLWVVRRPRSPIFVGGSKAAQNHRGVRRGLSPPVVTGTPSLK
ncbi:hypothetical protein [Mycolicibacterium sphagni]|uniref:Oligosaccharide repeat unit polymerase n=1 Tax=Mycolicibacterium sphagni TaxID=1786 RepID=A0ABX2JWV9_9MYCO|nr:hypothetical protein [Mycolicibacterium sphagni]NTY62229.1 hypothetical protein [Mycolicibacterium sphagni]